MTLEVHKTTATVGSSLVHEILEQQARAHSAEPAVTCGDYSLTYGQLFQWSDRLARRLREVGVRAETPVAIIADRRVETVVAILAVLKAGGFYVPIDPANPEERIDYILRDSGATVLLLPDSGESRPAGPHGYTVVSIAECRDSGAGLDPHTPFAQPDNACYMIYTSGSTGRPKGVVVTHRQLAKLCGAMSELDRPKPARFLLLISFSFDAVAIGLYWTLTTGGHVIIPRPEVIGNAPLLRDLAASWQITHLDCTPTLYSLLLGEDGAALSSLQCAIVGGEACPWTVVQRHNRLVPQAALINNYGPTETTVVATSAELNPMPESGRVPIGTPMPGVQTHVLDHEINAIPDGRTGELFIGGELVARGYAQRPALTAERFVPDPFADTSGARIYRTGDLAMVGTDGALEFRGRVDHQVKVRGYRIELGEVEAALAAVPGVRECAADARDIGGSTILAAWVAPQADTELRAAEIRDAVSAHLPGYMVPSRITFVERLPRNVAGKVEMRDLMLEQRAAPDAVEVPMTDLEQRIAEMACTVLGIDSIGRNDNFFDYGGTSIHVSHLLLQIWKAFEAAIPLHKLFQVPSVAGLAQIVELSKVKAVDHIESWTHEELEEACHLDPRIQVGDIPRSAWANPRKVLLTGATGYVGAFLLYELCRTGDAEIHCLVRADNDEHALARIEETMRRYLIWDDGYRAKIKAFVGDIGLPNMGVDAVRWNELAGEMDVIYHAGCLVNFLYPYSEIKGPNVDAVAEVLRLAVTTTLKAVHYISSIDLFLETHMSRPFLENQEPVAGEVPEGYARSKWVAEAYARDAQSRGIPVSIYRPGMMISQTDTGATQLNDYLLIQIAGLLEFGLAPDVHYVFDAVPIDYVTKAIVHIAQKEELVGERFNMWNLNPAPIEDVYQWIRDYGYEFKAVPFETLMPEVVKITPRNPLFPLVPLFLDVEHRLLPDCFKPEIMAATSREEECANTLAAIADSGIECPPMSRELAHKCFAYLEGMGFFPSPEEQRKSVAAWFA